MVTVKKIAEKLGLSSATVSRTLRNDETLSIAPETRSRILMAAAEMGYVSNKKKKKDGGKHVLILHKHQTFRNQIDSSYYFSMRTGIEDFLRKKKMDYSFLEIEALEENKIKPSAVILVGNYTKSQHDMVHGQFASIPVTVIGTVAYYADMVDHVTFSNHESVEIAIQYLFQNGHRDIGYLGVMEHEETIGLESRKQKFIDLMRSKNNMHEEWIYECDHGKDRVEEGYHAMSQWLDTNDPLPTAIFCANDPAALGAVKALQEQNIRVPDNISIVSHDGSYQTPFTYPELTTVDVHPYQLGFEGAALTYERLETKRRITKRLYLTPTLVIRESVKPQIS